MASTSSTSWAELLLRWEEARHAGKGLSLEELCRDHPEHLPLLQEKTKALAAMDWLQTPLTNSGSGRIGESVPRVFWSPGQEPVAGYRLVRPLGRGGFSEVWEATGPGEMRLALKLVFADRAGIEEKSLSLLRELRHPRIVSVFGAWKVMEGIIIAMEMGQESVYERWVRRRGDCTGGLRPPLRDGEPMSGEECHDVLQAGAEALDYLNQGQNVLHRDVKPHNLLYFDNYIKLTDFGIARIVSEHSTGHTGFYTLAYAPPEFFWGRTAKESDQYSLAVTYTLLRSGRLPFSGSSAELAHQHLHRSPDLSGLPARERSAVARALAKNPKDRWGSCGEFAEAVTNARRTYVLPSTRRKLLVGTAAAVVLGAGYFLWPRKGLVVDQEFEMPANKPYGLFVRTVVGARQARREVEKLLGVDFYVLANGMGGAFLWDGHTGKLLRQLSNEQGVAAAIPINEKPFCLLGHNTGDFDGWWMDSGNLLWKFKPQAVNHHVTSIDISRDSYRMVTSSTDRTLRVWEPPPVAPVRSNWPEQDRVLPLKEIRSESYVIAAKFLPNGREVLSVGHDGLLQIWDVETGQRKRKIDVSRSTLWALDISSDGNFALTGGEDRIVRLWNLNSGEKVRDFNGHEAKVETVKFSPTKDRIISGGLDHTARIWDMTTGKELLSVELPDEVHSVWPDGHERMVVGTRRGVYGMSIR